MPVLRTERQDRYRAVIGHFTTGVAIVTAQVQGGPVGMTANAVCSLSLEPMLLLVCFDNTARTLVAVRDSGRFAVNVLGRRQLDLAQRFASKVAEEDKFEDVAYRLDAGAPVLEGALAWVACEVRELIEGGDHTVAIGAVENMGQDSEQEPLVWYRGEYRTVGRGSPHLGLAPD